ncbi:MAG: YggS family pyridoxal phosphate-dependent enzyme [Gemmatimonadales bacterium]|nr:YggS family pyridoxal phosphate-dependent enzyme [Gemmatimonadales bacterium]
MPEAALPDRLARIRHAIAGAQAGHWTHPVRIVAVTKTHGADAVRAARAAGLDAVGENRVQEALSKQDECADVAVAWHLVGGLQRNKARQVVGRFTLIHSVDRLDLAAELARRADGGTTQDVLVQVNCSAEPQKGGVEPGELVPLLEGIRLLPALQLRGLMTMAALGAGEAEQRRTFASLRTLRDAAQAEGHDLPELSMGMSDDYVAAVQEGATMLRLGTALFGGRP